MDKQNAVAMLNDENAGRYHISEKVLHSIVEEYGNDDFVVEKILKNHPEQIENVDKKYWAKEEVMRQVVSKRPYLIQFADKSIKNDLMFLAVKQDKQHKQSHFDKGQDGYFRRDIVYKPVNGALRYATEDWIKDNIDFIIEQNPGNLQYLEGFKSNPEVVWKAVKESASAWEHVDKDFKESEQGKVMMCATDLQYLASHMELMDNPEFALQVISKNANALKSTNKLNGDKNFLLEAIKNNGNVFNLLDDNVRNDPDFMKAVAEVNPQVVEQYGWLFKEMTQPDIANKNIEEAIPQEPVNEPAKVETNKPVKLSKFKQIWQGAKGKVKETFDKIAAKINEKTHSKTKEEEGQSK